MNKLAYYTLMILSISITTLGCGDGSGNGPVRVGVRGEVSLNGQPLDNARILFESSDGQNSVKAVGSIVNGSYEIPSHSGPLVGTARVKIQPETLDLEEFVKAQEDSQSLPDVNTISIPEEYNTASTLEVKVLEDESQNSFNFNIKS